MYALLESRSNLRKGREKTPGTVDRRKVEEGAFAAIRGPYF